MGSNAYGSNIPLPIWIDLMEVALKEAREENAVQPSCIVSLRINPDTGLPTSEPTESSMFDYFYTEHLPSLDASPIVSKGEKTRNIEAVDLFN